MGNDLEGKVILLTGGASGIGRECALAYAREADDFEDAALKQREAYERVNALIALIET